MNVLSLFDGMSCGQIALNRAGIKYDKYFASEVDKYAIQITQKNYPDTIQLGDVKEVKGCDLPKIDLLIGGSPCQGFSFAGKQLNFDDPRSKLFFEYVRLLKELRPRYFLLENVRMKKESMRVISDSLGVDPILINSSLVSAQNRNRYYWTNIPCIFQPHDKGIVLKDILEDGFCDRNKSFCIDANYFKGGNLKNYFDKNRRQLVFSNNGLCHVADADIKGNDSIRRVYHPDGKSPTLTTMGGGHREPKVLQINPSKSAGGKQPYMQDRVFHIEGKSHCLTAGYAARTNIGNENELTWRKLTPIECERLQTVPDNYTEGVSNTQRYKMLGNGWTVDVIVHIFQGLKNDYSN